MNAQSLLDQLLRSGMSALGNAGQAARGNDMGKYATGAAVGGALGLLLGSKRGRGIGGKALKYGSVAAIGALAWKVYQDYQAGQRAQAPAGAAGAPQRSMPAALPAPTFEALPAPHLELHAQAMLKAMIAAAKSDGHMDERERELVGNELDRLQADPATRQWVEAEIRRPVDPADVARAASTPELAAEVYLASVLVVDDTTAMERAYLDQLAQALRLAPQLKADLEARATAAG